MATAGTVFAGPALARKIQADYIRQWQTHYEMVKSEYPFVKFGRGTEDYSTMFGYGTTPTYPSRVNWGDRPDEKPHKYVTWTVEQFRWMSKVVWRTLDRELSNLGSIESDALKAGDEYGGLFERVLYQIVNAGTDPLLLPTVPNAPDGAAIASATDGTGADRFGVSGGTIVPSQLWTSGQGVQNGLYAALTRMGQFLNPQGFPSCDAGVLKAGVTYIASIQLAEVIHQAFKQRFPSNSTVTAGAVQVSNLVLDAGIPVRLVLTPYITSTTVAHVISDKLHGADGGTPLITEVTAKAPEEKYYDASNDRDYGERGLEGAHWESWFAASVQLPRGYVELTT